MLKMRDFWQLSYKLFLTGFMILALWSIAVGSVLACQEQCPKGDDEDAYLQCLKDQQSCWQGKINEAKAEQNTLQSTISILNGQINVQSLEIEQTQAEISRLERQIADLGNRIEGIETSLDQMSQNLIQRIQASYRQDKSSPLELLLLSGSLDQFINVRQYLAKAQQHLSELMTQAETQKQDYDQQKATKEELQTEIAQKQIQLESEQAQLASQRGGFELLLEETKRDEQIYQQKLDQLQSELESINAIIAGRGDEEFVREVAEGEKIASVIAGSSCNSSGSHLDLMVTSLSGEVKNPLNYLRPIDNYINCSGYGANGCFAGDPFNPSGSWPWPLNGTIQMNQGHGYTWAVKNTWVSRIYSYHSGIDLVSNDLTVKAIQPGRLYRGSFTGSGGCRLRYVKVEHSQGGLQSYYLHVNY